MYYSVCLLTHTAHIFTFRLIVNKSIKFVLKFTLYANFCKTRNYRTHKMTKFVDGVRRLFYVVSPNETSFETVEEVPYYIAQAIPFFIFLIFVEYVAQVLTGKKRTRLNDGITSVGSGLFSETVKFLLKGSEVMTYLYIYENYRLTTLPWNSAWTWFICFLGVDLAYYWFHRMAHEVNFMWAAHQVHHSSEEYNLTTALRQSAVQFLTSIAFYLPMAFAIPPPIFIVHTQFNLLYQFWIHTEVVGHLGPLEYIINTPSSHRVHHGRNRYCIDKNYAGTLIIWDRLFGTYVPEKETVVFGLTHPLNSFDPNYVQWGHFVHIWNTFWATPGFGNKLSVLFKGPGWSPGKPRMGCIEDIPDVHAPVELYDQPTSGWTNAYGLVHFTMIMLTYQSFLWIREDMSLVLIWTVSLYIVFSLSCIGALLDQRIFGVPLEFVRCLLCVLTNLYTRWRYNTSWPILPKFGEIYLPLVYTFSLILWTVFLFKRKVNTSKKAI